MLTLLKRTVWNDKKLYANNVKLIHLKKINVKIWAWTRFHIWRCSIKLRSMPSCSDRSNIRQQKDLWLTKWREKGYPHYTAAFSPTVKQRWLHGAADFNRGYLPNLFIIVHKNLRTYRKCKDSKQTLPSFNSYFSRLWDYFCLFRSMNC